MIAFGWLNFSAADMKRAKEAIAKLREPGSIDELGISIIRNGFAEKLFPGLNVAQTSLKYFLLIPAMLHDLEKEFTVQENKDIRFQLEYDLTVRECKFCDNACKYRKNIGTNTEGIIGSDSAGNPNYTKRMLRFPHNIYWHGLDIFGLLPEDSSSLHSFCENMRERKKDPGDDKVKRDKKLPWGEDFSIYNSIPDIHENLDPLALTDGEYKFLKGKMQATRDVKGSALEVLLRKNDNAKLSEAKSAVEIRDIFQQFGETAQKAAQFGIFMRCAFLAYNIAFQMYCDCSNEAKGYLKDFYDMCKESPHDLSIPDEFNFSGKRPKTWTAMQEFHKFISGEMKGLLEEEILSHIKDLMTRWEEAAGKKVRYLKTPVPEKAEWLGPEFLDFRYNTAVRLFAEYVGKGGDHGHDSETI